MKYIFYKLNTFQVESDSCNPCPEGHFAGVTGLTKCAACPVGEFANVTGSDDCTLCSAGTDIYQLNIPRDAKIDLKLLLEIQWIGDSLGLETLT